MGLGQLAAGHPAVIILLQCLQADRAKDLLRSGEPGQQRSEEHTSELQSPCNLVCRLLLEKKEETPVVHSHWNIVLLLLLALTNELGPATDTFKKMRTLALWLTVDDGVTLRGAFDCGNEDP